MAGGGRLGHDPVLLPLSPALLTVPSISGGVGYVGMYVGRFSVGFERRWIYGLRIADALLLTGCGAVGGACTK